MWLHVAQSVLYQTFVSQSSAYGEVHVAMASSQGGTRTDVVSLFAAKDLKPRTLLLLPFNMPLVSGSETRPSGAVQAILRVSPSNEAPASTVFWIRPKVLPKKSTDPRAWREGADDCALLGGSGQGFEPRWCQEPALRDSHHPDSDATICEQGSARPEGQDDPEGDVPHERGGRFERDHVDGGENATDGPPGGQRDGCSVVRRRVDREALSQDRIGIS